MEPETVDLVAAREQLRDAEARWESAKASALAAGVEVGRLRCLVYDLDPDRRFSVRHIQTGKVTEFIVMSFHATSIEARLPGSGIAVVSWFYLKGHRWVGPNMVILKPPRILETLKGVRSWGVRS